MTTLIYYAPATQADLIKAALRVIEADHYAREEDPHKDAEREYAGEQLALAARAHAAAVDRLAVENQPTGWKGDRRHTAKLTQVERAVGRLVAAGDDPTIPAVRALRAALIEEFGIETAQAFVYAAQADRALGRLERSLGEDGVALIRAALRSALAPLIGGE